MLEKTVANGIVNMGGLTMQLDIERQYSYIDKNESQWRFSFQQVGDEEGWFAWLKKPGSIEMCVGRVGEKDLAKKLEENPPLTPDDLIDLELWLIHGGLENLGAKRKRKPKQENNT